jgi:GTPase SAR1 family protein
MASPPEAVVGSTLETQSTHVAVKVQTAPKEEEGNLDLSAIPHKTDMKPNVLGTTTASASDKVSATTDMFKNALDGQVNDGTTTIASTSDENSKDGSSVSHCKTFANMERVRFGTQETISEGVKLGLKTLDSLANLLNIEGPDGQEASRWLTRFEIIQKKLEQTRTVVGIMGNTGAGKSSLINALLDEEDIIPTSSICACTAVPTEISYNHDADPERAYRGEVEFITEEEWQKEISILLQELVEPGKKLSAEYLQKDTGAGVAYAKIKAVYPNLTNSQLAKSDVKDLMNDPVVKAVLGQVRLHKRSSASDLKSDLQMYVGGPKKNSPDTQGQTPMAYWPLTKIVRIYLKSKVLSTGTVLVDLPGVQDSNAARSAVADRFRAECSSIWIVSPIARAVDDKAAKNLLGTSFKLQLTMDGNYGNVTYICSKTDDIAEREVADILDSDGSIQSLWVKEEECKRKLSLLMHEKRKLGEERDAVEELREELESRTTRKRKIANISESSEPQKGTGADLDEQDVARKNANRIRKQLKAVKSEIGALQEEIKSLSIFATVRCIEARNNYSMTAIRSDFADGVREMLEDAEAQDTGVELPAVEPDYEQIAQSLPVFCVSSRGYQNLMGRSKDRAVQAYRNLEDTQIPQLQNHAVQLGELELTTTRRAFLASLARIMRSLLLWASSSISAGQTPTNPPLPDKKSQTHRLDKLIAALQADLDEGIKTAIATIKAKIHDDLLKPMSSMCIHASPSLHTIASKWPESQTKAGKPMRFSTYRSICVNQ